MILTAFVACHSAHSQALILNTQVVNIDGDAPTAATFNSAERSEFESVSYTSGEASQLNASDPEEIGVTFLTDVNPNFGVYWGFSAGDYGQSQSMDPSLRLGFIAKKPAGKNSSVSFSLISTIGGDEESGDCSGNAGNCATSARSVDSQVNSYSQSNAAASDRFRMVLRYQLAF